MSDYISREAAIAYIREQSEEMQKAFEELGGESGIYADAYNDLAEEFHRIPAADVEPVRHGRWECVYDDNTGETDITCSHCKNTRTVNGCFVSTDGKSCYFEDDYCPNCGSKMDLEGEKNDD